MCARVLRIQSVLWLLLCVWEAYAHFAFFRSLQNQNGGRRAFGGSVARLSAWPAACALLDRELFSRCSCAVLAPRWALTVAHCAVPAISYVQYNGQEPGESNVAIVYLLYAHPEFHTVSKDMGYGPEVVLLHHDVGLVRTRDDMRLQGEDFSTLGPRTTFPWAKPLANGADPDVDPNAELDRDPNAEVEGDPIAAIARYDPRELVGHQINVLGFGITEQLPVGERLREVQLRLVACEQEGWLNCACAQGTAREVCSGDSGGPVIYKGTQIGVTSMGPLECGVTSVEPGRDVRSVFTALQPYASIINATMHDDPNVPNIFRLRVKFLADQSVRYKSLHITHCQTESYAEGRDSRDTIILKLEELGRVNRAPEWIESMGLH